MGLNLVWIYFLVLCSDFSLSKDVIEGIPSNWKRLNNPDHHKIHSLQDKIPTSYPILRPTKIIPSDLQSYKIMHSTKNATETNLNSISDTKTTHNNENMNVENKNTIYDKQQHNINEVLRKRTQDTEFQNTSNDIGNVDTSEKPKHAELDIVHKKDKLITLFPRKNDTSSHFSNKGLTISEEPEEHEDVTSHNKEQNKNENNDKLILKSHDLNRRNSVNSGKIENDETSHDDQQNVKPKILHSLYNPRGWIRYYRPNQYSLSNHSNNNINELYSKTKYFNPFYVTQSPFTRHLSYGADKRYRRSDVRYQNGL